MTQTLVVEVDKEGTKKIGFKAKKTEGQGIGRGHCWGELVFLDNKGFIALNAVHQGKIVFLKSINAFVLSKAKALGVKGLIGLKINKKFPKNTCPLPLLLIPDKEKALLAIKKASGVKCLLDVKNNCLLIPVGAGKPNDH